MGIVAITLLFFPFELKFLSISTQPQLTVTYRNPRFTLVLDGEFVHVFARTTVFTGKPNKGPKLRRFNCLEERILHVLSYSLSFNSMLLSESLLLIISNVQYPSPKVIPVILSFAPFKTFLNSQKIQIFFTHNLDSYFVLTNLSR